ncbi:hypothetical protein Tco_1446833 [Tanacetum coccineum]
MSSTSKLGLGYEIKSNNEVLSYEEEMNFFVFNSTEEDSVGKPLYIRFIKTNDFKGVPHPLSGDYTPKPQEEIDESLYVYSKKGPQEPEPSVSDDRSSEFTQEVFVSKPITTNEKGVSVPKSKEVEPSCVTYIKTPRQPIKDHETPKVNRKNWNAMMKRELGEGYSFTKKKCFVCGSLSHLIKDCDYYEKKMAKEAEVKKQRVCNTGNMMAKPVRTNTNRINHANQFIPRPVQLNTGSPNINSVRTNINTSRTNINSVRHRVNTVNTNVNTVRSRQPDHPLKNMVDKGIFDSGCLGHMTVTRQLEEFEEFNGDLYLWSYMIFINANVLSNIVSLQCLSSLLNTLLQNTMAEQNVPNQPPTRTDEQIVPRSQWLTIGKSNLLFNAQKIQKNPIFQISVDILSNTNFFQAFTASANVPAIYLQQFWNTMKYNEKTGVYSCQVDEQWFDLSADLLRKALAITPVIPAQPFELPPSGNTVIDFVNELGYPEPVEIVSNIRVNYVYQPWRAILTLINQCLTGKTSGSDKPRHPVLQMLWGIVTQTNVDHAELLWEEFTQGIQTFFSYKASHKASRKDLKKKVTPLLIPYGRFSKVIIYYLASNNNIHRRHDSAIHHTGDDFILGNLKFIPKGETVEVFGMAIPDPLITEAIQQSSYYPKYMEMVAENTKKTQQESKVRKGKPTFQLVDKDDVAQQESVPQEEGDDPDLELAKKMCLEAHQEKGEGEGDDADMERAIKLSLDPAFLPQGQAPVGGVTIRDPVSETTPKLPKVVGKGKAIVTEEQVAHSLIDLSKKKRTTDQFILVRRNQAPHDSTTGPSSQPEDDTSEKVIHESSSTSDSERTESETEATAPKDLEKAHKALAGPDPEPMQEDQTGSNSGKLHVSLAGPNPEHMDDEFLATAYPKVHENLKLITDERVIEENPESHSGSMSSMKNLDDTYNFGDQFLYDKPTEDDQEKSKVIEESDSTIPDPSHQTVTSTPPVIAPFTDVSSTKPSSLVTPPPINTEATTITTSLPEITPFIALQLRGEGEGDDADMERAIKLSLDPAFLPQGQAPVGGVTIRDPVSETTPKLPEVVGKGKAIVTEEQVAHSLIDLSKKKRTTDQFILVRRDQTPHDSTTGPSSQPEDDTSEKVIHESSSTSDSERTESETETAAPKASVARIGARDVWKSRRRLITLLMFWLQSNPSSYGCHLSNLVPSRYQELKKSQRRFCQNQNWGTGEGRIQDSTYSIRSTDKVALEEFDLKSALFKHMNKNKTANRNPANLPSIPCSYGSF